MTASADYLNADFQPDSFAFDDESRQRAELIIARYPPGKQASAVMPLLDLAQRQHGGWLPRIAMDVVADMLEMPRVRVYEVATFYTMYNLKPIGRFHVQVCTTTPCWLCGSADIVNAIKGHLGIDLNQTTDDGLFTLTEVECLGACVNAPMMQVNDDYFEDLTPDLTVSVLNALAKGDAPPIGSQAGRRGSMAVPGPTTLADQAKEAGVPMANATEG